MAVFTDYGWCRVEGCNVDINKVYGISPNYTYPFVNIPSSLRIFYSQPEIQIFNPYSDIQHVIYKVVPLSELNPSHASDYDTIADIDSNYNNLISDIDDYPRQIIKDDTVNSSDYYFKPFVLPKSAVVFYDQDTSQTFSHQQLILVDDLIAPHIIAINGGYLGSPVPVNDTYEEDKLKITAVYEDGNTAILREGYTVEPNDKVISKAGVNIFKVEYITPTGESLSCNLSITGIKKAVSIFATYDGPRLTVGNQIDKRYLVVVVYFSDGSSATITDYSMPEGNTITQENKDCFLIVYKGLRTTVSLDVYTVTSARLTAYYNGPPVEIGYDFDIERCSIRIHYKDDNPYAENSGWENVEPSQCTYSITTVNHEGINNILVSYNSRFGVVKCYMAVVGIRPEKKLVRIEALYTGPEIVQSDLTLDPPFIETFSIERILCKAFYTDGSIETIKNFFIDKNYVTNVGNNAIQVTYRNQHDEEASTYVNIIGLAKDDTMQDNSYDISLNNYYPEATRLNHRYRGPAEAYKQDSFSKLLISNLKTLYALFKEVEDSYNTIAKVIEDGASIKLTTLHSIHAMEDTIYDWEHDPRFSKGYYTIPKEGKG